METNLGQASGWCPSGFRVASIDVAPLVLSETSGTGSQASAQRPARSSRRSFVPVVKFEPGLDRIGIPASRYRVIVAPTGDADRASRIAAFARGLREIRPECIYFAAALFGSDTGWNLAFGTGFAGFLEGRGPDSGVELREPVPVYPDRITQLWEDLGRSWIVVNERVQLIWFLRYGGNALIAEEVAREHLAEFIQPVEMVPNGAMGFRRFDPNAREVRHRRPRPRQREQILQRDSRRCQVCERQPSDDGDIRLELHHIRPFGMGGLTIEENLITVCNECHNSFDPHYQPGLFWLPDGHARRALERNSTDAHNRGVEAYRRLAARVFEARADPSGTTAG